MERKPIGLLFNVYCLPPR